MKKLLQVELKLCSLFDGAHFQATCSNIWTRIMEKQGQGFYMKI